MENSETGIQVGDTPYGQGVFATRRFPLDAVIHAVAGDIIYDPDYGSDYCIDLGEGFSLEPSPPMSFLNHSCDPNCELQIFEEEGKPAPCADVMLVALRPIEAGEQLTIDYAWPADSAIPCLCGVASCRGWIVDPDELPQAMATLAE